MNERTPGKPGDKPAEEETARAKPSDTDPPASAERPSVARSDEDGATARKRRTRLNLKAKDANDVHAPPPDLATRFARLSKRDWHGKIIRWHSKEFKQLQDADIEDIFHNACIKALDEDDWPAEEKPTLTWLFKITRNTQRPRTGQRRPRIP